MERIAAKPTLFMGVAFRSRLEARWALIFDELGIEWEYEPITFPSGYTPDFRLEYDSGEGDYVEVKPGTNLVSTKARQKLLADVLSVGLFEDPPDSVDAAPVSLILLGPPPRITSPATFPDPMWTALGHREGRIVYAGASLDGGKSGPFSFAVYRESAKETGMFVWEPSLDLAFGEANPRLVRAFQKASIARLEDF